MRRWVVVALALVLFGSGILTGGAVTVAYVVSKARYAARHPDEAHRKTLERMVGRLGLSPEQRARVEAVIARRQAAMRMMRTEFQPRVRSELDATARQIETELTPDQVRRWRVMMDRLKENWMPEAEPGKVRQP